jgi:hypothetical protein
VTGALKKIKIHSALANFSSAGIANMGVVEAHIPPKKRGLSANSKAPCFLAAASFSGNSKQSSQMLGSTDSNH